MSRLLAVFAFGLFLGTVAGILLWPFLVYRQSGAIAIRASTVYKFLSWTAHSSV